MRIKDITKESQQLDENIFKLGLDAFKRGTKFLKGKTKSKSLDAKTARAVNRASKSLMKAICLPSGDQTGQSSHPGVSVSWVRPVPSVFIR